MSGKPEAQMEAQLALATESAEASQARLPMTMIQALRSAMDVMLERDDNVVVYGEDVGYFGGVFRCTEGLQKKYGTSRVFDAPISESGIVGAAIGNQHLRRHLEQIACCKFRSCPGRFCAIFG